MFPQIVDGKRRASFRETMWIFCTFGVVTGMTMRYPDQGFQQTVGDKSIYVCTYTHTHRHTHTHTHTHTQIWGLDTLLFI